MNFEVVLLRRLNGFQLLASQSHALDIKLRFPFSFLLFGFEVWCCLVASVHGFCPRPEVQVNED